MKVRNAESQPARFCTRNSLLDQQCVQQMDYSVILTATSDPPELRKVQETHSRCNLTSPCISIATYFHPNTHFKPHYREVTH